MQIDLKPGKAARRYPSSDYASWPWAYSGPPPNQGEQTLPP